MGVVGPGDATTAVEGGGWFCGTDGFESAGTTVATSGEAFETGWFAGLWVAETWFVETWFVEVGVAEAWLAELSTGTEGTESFLGNAGGAT